MMPDTAMTARDDAGLRDGETSIGELVARVCRFYLRFGRWLGGLALLAGIAAGAWAALHPLYRVDALLSTPGLNLDQWRQVRPLLTDRVRIAATLAGLGLHANDPAVAALGARLGSAALWDNAVQYRMTVERDDLRQQIPAEILKNVGPLGLEITLLAPGRDQATRLLDTMAAHVRQTLLWNGLVNFLTDRAREVAAGRPGLEIKLIESQFTIDQSQQRIEDMRALRDAYPELRQMNPNTVVSVQDGGGKYLSPLAQIVALQATISETRAAMSQARRDLDRLDQYRTFLGGLPPATQQASGDALAGAMAARMHAVFPAGASLPPVAQQVADEIARQLDTLHSVVAATRFRAEPAVSPAPIASRRPVLVGFAAFVLVLAALSAAVAGWLAVRRLAVDGGRT